MIAGVRFVMTEGGRSGSILLQDLQGYTFSFNGAYKSGIQRWQCSRKRNIKCKAYVRVENSEVDKGRGQALQVNQHCHPPIKSE